MKTKIYSYKELLKHLTHQGSNNQDICLTDCDILFDVNISELLFITQNADYKTDNNTIHKAIRIRNCIFRKIEIRDIIFEGEVTIVSSSFEDIYGYSSVFNNKIMTVDTVIICSTLKDCHFSDDVQWSFTPNHIVQSIDIEDTIFDRDFELSNLLMSKKLDDMRHYTSSSFDIYGGNTIIKHDLIIRNSIFLDSTIDIRCNIEHELTLHNINNVDNKEISINGYVGTLLIDSSHISTLNVINCNLGVIDILNTTFGNINEHQFSCKRMKNDAATIFRNFAIQHSNPILENKYTAEFYDNLLRQKTADLLRSWIDSISNRKKYTFGNKKSLYNYLEPIILFIPSLFSSERLLLWLNKYSNDFNRSWIRGVIFTLLSTLIFYFIINYFGTDPQYFIIDFKFQNFDKVLEGYLSLLDIFNISNIDQPMQLTIWGKAILFIAKIFIAYGSWQTIYAFYKYKR